jgi:hypothetical protein
MREAYESDIGCVNVRAPRRSRRGDSRYDPRQQVSAAVSSRRVKRECGAAWKNLPRESRGCPRNGKPLEVRSNSATAAVRGGKAGAVRKG